MDKIIVSNIYSKYETEDREILEYLKDKMTFKDPNAIYSEKYNTFNSHGQRIWDGTVVFFNSTNGVFLTGHLPFIISFLKNKKISTIIKNVGPIPNFKTELKTKIGTFELRDYQIAGVKQAIDKHRGIFYHPTGCLSGDSIINVHRNGKGYKIKISDLYKRFNCLDSSNYNYTNGTNTYVRSYNNKTVQLQPIDNVVYSGKKEVYTLILDNGFTLNATKDHLIFTDCGWKRLDQLNNQLVALDTLRPIKSMCKIKKVYDSFITNMKYHPFAKLTKVRFKTKPRFFYEKRIEKHRAVYEAHINNLTLDQYKDILRHNNEKAKTLLYINPKIYHIHHKDRNHYNNKINNLELLTKYEHLLLHSSHTKFNFNQGILQYSKVKNIVYRGYEDTYDIQCPTYHNFVANGIIVHNSGKSLLALAIIESTPVNTLFLVDRMELLHQAFKMFKKNASRPVGVISSSEFEPRDITIGMQRTIHARLRNKNYKDYMKEYLNTVQMVFCDETHRASAKTWREVLRGLPNAYFRYGLSGTPLIEDKIRNMYTVGYIGQIIHKVDTKNLVDDSYLAKPIINIVKLSNYKLSEAYDYDKIYKDGIVNNEERNRKIADIVRSYKQTNKSILIVVKHIEHGKNIQKILTEDNSYFFVSGESTKDERLYVYNKFLSKDLPIVISSLIYKEGVDIPAIDVLIYAAGDKAPVTILQVLGRGLRIREDKDELQYYDFYDTCNHFLHTHATKRLKLYEDQGLTVHKLRETPYDYSAICGH